VGRSHLCRGCFIQPLPELGGVGVIERFVQPQRLLPGAAGRAVIPGRVVDIAQAGQGYGLVVAVADLPEEVRAFPVAGDGLAMIGASVVDVAETVP